MAFSKYSAYTQLIFRKLNLLFINNRYKLDISIYENKINLNINILVTLHKNYQQIHKLKIMKHFNQFQTIILKIDSEQNGKASNKNKSTNQVFSSTTLILKNLYLF